MKKISTYKENEIILREGQSIGNMFKIISGHAVLYLNYGKENEYCFGILSKQRYFGEEGVLMSKSAVFTAVSADDCTVMEISSEDFEEFILSSHSNMLDIMRDMTKKMNTLKTHLSLLDDELSFNIKAQEFRAKCNKATIENYLAVHPDLGGSFKRKI